MELAAVYDFVAQRRFAMVGLSRKGGGFGNMLRSSLSSKGYQLRLVHHEATEIGGLPCAPSLSALHAELDGSSSPESKQMMLDGVILVTPPAVTERLVDEAIAAGITRIWMQQGAESPAAIERARAAGVSVVHGRCLMMFTQPTGVHRFHRWLLEVFGRLPKQAALKALSDDKTL